jgi:hypothetical protein
VRRASSKLLAREGWVGGGRSENLVGKIPDFRKYSHNYFSTVVAKELCGCGKGVEEAGEWAGGM